MNSKAANAFLLILIVSLLITGTVWAQARAATLSGTVTNPSGAAVPNAKVSARNLATGQSIEARTDAAGLYTIPNLIPGEYEVSVSAEGFGPTTSKVTLAAGTGQTMNLALPASSGNPAEPSLGDLGFTPEQTKGSAQDQARLDKRSHMLKTHQRLGLITLGSLAGYAHHFQRCRRQEKHGFRPRSACRTGRRDGGPVLHDRLLCHLRAQGAGDHGARAHPAAQGPGLDSWPGHDSDSHPGRPCVSATNRGEKVHGIASLHSAVGSGDRRSLWAGDSVRIDQVLSEGYE